MTTPLNLPIGLEELDIGHVDWHNEIHAALNALTKPGANRYDLIPANDGTTNQTAALQALIDAAGNRSMPGVKLQSSSGAWQSGNPQLGAGVVELGPGVMVIGRITGRNNVKVRLNGTYLRMAPNTAAGWMFANQRDTSVHAGGFLICGSGWLDGNKSAQTAVVGGVLFQGDETNTYNSPLDPDYDINSGIQGDIFIRNFKGDGVRMYGAGGNKMTGGWVIERCDGIGLNMDTGPNTSTNVGGQDNQIADGHISWSGLEGMVSAGESTTVDNVKIWYAGAVNAARGTGAKITADSGKYDLNVQDCKGAGVLLDGAHGVIVDVLADSNSKDSPGTYPAVDIYNSSGCFVTGVARNRYKGGTTLGEQRAALRMRSANNPSTTVENRVVLQARTAEWGNAGTALVTADSVLTGNTVIINGETLSGPSTPGGGGTTEPVSGPTQTFEARLDESQTAAVAVLLAGSSSTQGEAATAKSFRFVDRLVAGWQLGHPSGRPSSNAQSLETPVQDLIGGVGGFTSPDTMVGVHGYNVGKSGSKSNDFLLNADIPALCALNPAGWVIMVGSNDAAENVAPSTYKSNLLGKISLIKANMPPGAKYAIFLVHQYQRPAQRNPTYAWSLYGQALSEIAAADPTLIRFADMSASLPNLPGPDNATALGTGDINADLIHMTNQGHGKWAAAEHQMLSGVALPAGTPNFSAPASSNGTETFTYATSSTVVPNWTSAAGVHGVSADGKAYLASGSNGVLTRAVNVRNGEVSAVGIMPASGFVGVRGRVTSSNEAVSTYVDTSARLISLSTVIAGTNTNLLAGVALPSSVVAGSTITLTLVMDNDAISSYLNGVFVQTATLSAQQMAQIDGSDIGLRQTVAGVANGAWDSVSWKDSVTSTPGSGVDPGAGTTLASDNFPGSAGTAWSSQWTSSYGTGPTATVNGSNQGVLTTPATAYGAARYQYLTGSAAASDSELRFDWSFDTNIVEQYFAAALRSPGTIDSGTGNPLSCYNIYLNPNAGTIRLQRRASGGGATELGSIPWTYVTGQDISIRFSAVNSDIKFRAWVAGTTEPTTWSVAVSDSTWAGPGKPFFRYGNGPAAAAKTGTLSNLSLTLPGSTAPGGGAFVATANTPMPTGNLPGWDQVVAEDFNTNVAQGSSGFRAAYPNMTTYDNFGDTAWNAIVKRDRDAGGPGTPDPSKAGWYSDKSLWVANSQLICDVGWDAALQKNLVSFILPRRYTGQIMGRVDFLLRTDEIMNYKIVPLWWSVRDQWPDGEIDYPESNDLGTTFKAYIHNTLGNPGANVKAVEPVRIPGVTVAPRLDSWHVFSQQWTETEISFWLDGVKVVSYTKPADGNGFPTQLMRFGLQIEAKDLGGFTTIERTAKGKVQIGWVVQYTRNAATA